MQDITLNNPITVDGISVSELTVRRPKVYNAPHKLDQKKWLIRVGR